ncbi:uncharacterized protein LOC144361221 [Saccoglossus kowalevskii]
MTSPTYIPGVSGQGRTALLLRDQSHGLITPSQHNTWNFVSDNMVQSARWLVVGLFIVMMPIPAIWCFQCYACDWHNFHLNGYAETRGDINCVDIHNGNVSTSLCGDGRVCKLAKTYYNSTLTVVSRSCVYEFMCEKKRKEKMDEQTGGVSIDILVHSLILKVTLCEIMMSCKPWWTASRPLRRRRR